MDERHLVFLRRVVLRVEVSRRSRLLEAFLVGGVLRERLQGALLSEGPPRSFMCSVPEVG